MALISGARIIALIRAGGMGETTKRGFVQKQRLFQQTPVCWTGDRQPTPPVEPKRSGG
jgi:hypothetical protein